MANTAFVLNGTIGLLSNRNMLAGAGKLFTVTNPTIGTPVVGALKAAWSATANGLFVISNNNAANGASIYLDRMQLRLRATAPTGTLTMQIEAYNETGIVVGTTAVATATPVQGNTALPQTTGAVVQAFAAGAITIPAAVGTRRLQDMTMLPTGVAVDGDTYVVLFGQDGTGADKQGITAARATDPARLVANMGPVVIAPQTTSWLNMWWLTAAVNIPSWEFSLTYAEL